MEKKASRLLSVLGKVGRGIKSAPGRVLNHVLDNPIKYMLGGGLAGWGAYNYLNTGKIDPETGMPVLPRDRAFLSDTAPIVGYGKHNFSTDDERLAYARAAEDYKNKRGYYEKMPLYQKFLPFSMGDARRIHHEFYQHSGPRTPIRGRYRAGSDSADYDIQNMSNEDAAALNDPKVRDAVYDSLDTQPTFIRDGSQWYRR